MYLFLSSLPPSLCFGGSLFYNTVTSQSHPDNVSSSHKHPFKVKTSSLPLLLARLYCSFGDNYFYISFVIFLNLIGLNILLLSFSLGTSLHIPSPYHSKLVTVPSITILSHFFFGLLYPFSLSTSM